MTREVQFDEKWSFVGKKESSRDLADPADAEKGDSWDHVAFDPEHRLVIVVVLGKRISASAFELLREFHRRTGGRLPRLITTDEYSAYRTEILAVYGQLVFPPRLGRRGPPPLPHLAPTPELVYGIVHKTREDDRVVKVERRLIFGTADQLQAALESSRVSSVVNTSFLERHHATDRRRNARKTRGSRAFSKNWDIHRAVTFFTMYSYNFCWPVASLSEPGPDGRRRRRTPAMAAGLADHEWSLQEWLARPVVQRD